MMVQLKVSRSTIAAHRRGSEGFRPARKRFVAYDRDGVLLFPFSEDLEEELGAAPVQFHLAKFIDAEQVHTPVAG